MSTPNKPKMQNLQSPKGMHDILPQDQAGWDKVRKELQNIADHYHYRRIETTLMERAEVFEKTLGETTDVVEKQMFVYKSRSGDRLALRPEATASIVRSYLQHGLAHLGQPLKLFYLGPMFRKEQPQAGRFRQFHQMGFEIIGGDDEPVYDAQIILAMYRLLERLKIKQVTVRVNSIGCRICRPNYRKKLIEYYKNPNFKLCKDCRRRLRENPLRLLDCKNPTCQEYKAAAPISLDSLCVYCNKHLKDTLEFLDELKISYQVDHQLVRGLDYYSRTVFEMFTEATTAEGAKFDFALGGGGRYDYLIEMLGGRPAGAVGGALGVERVLEVLKAMKGGTAAKDKTTVFFIHIGDAAKKKSLALIESLREAGIPMQESLGKDSLGAQLRAANKEGSRLALIFGQKEAFEDAIIIRDLDNSVQETVPLKKVVTEVKKRLK